MHKRIAPLAIVALLAFPIITMAQDATTIVATDVAPLDVPPTDVAQTADVVSVGNFDYDLPSDEPVAVCIDAREDTLDGATVTYRVFIHSGEDWLAMPTVTRPAEGRTADGTVGSCYALDAEAVTT